MVESLGDILKRMTANASSRNTTPGEDKFQASSELTSLCSICGDLGWVRHKVPVNHPDFGELYPCRCQKPENLPQRRQILAEYSGLPSDMMERMTFEGFDPAGNAADREDRFSLEHALTAAKTFVRYPDGWLLLAGPHGCGKTHLSAAIIGESIRAGQVAFFAFVPDLLDHLRSTFSPHSSIEYDHLFEQVKSIPLLVLDDLGAESGTQWAQEKLYQLFVHRHNRRLPTVINTYLPMKELEHAHPRVASRLKDTALVNWIPISAPDFRDSLSPNPHFTKNSQRKPR